MDMIEAMKVAVAVARHNSFSSASRDLRLSAASVSRIVADLEADLGVRLFNRTTRKINLTDAGVEFVQKSTSLLEELDVMRSAVRERHETPRGQLHVSCVTAFGNEPGTRGSGIRETVPATRCLNRSWQSFGRSDW
ncbi:LysR family transcriptional regulator [Mesorhizobium sp.]|uniref:LysR family transcriptional regulator n=1 Tax=Mesorhizobium sp. TaxID=1871066 RepID=UPI000FE95655|nr:LysR family transcriptional regulator [Mesorhizobium sp.]RWA57964.1 MAG: LysR family transcriptional regulator [Mesorhizobium sp.]